MTYVPPKGNEVVLNFTGSYTPPVGDSVRLIFGDISDNNIQIEDIIIQWDADGVQVSEAVLIDIEEIVIEFDLPSVGVVPLAHLAFQDVEFEFELPSVGVQILPDMIVDNVIFDYDLDNAEVGGGAVTDLPSRFDTGFTFPYTKPLNQDTNFNVRWGLFTKIDFPFIVPNIPPYKIDLNLISSWVNFYAVDKNITEYSSSFIYLVDEETLFAWGSYFITDVFDKVSYGSSADVDKKFSFNYHSVSVKLDIGFLHPYSSTFSSKVDVQKVIPWGKPSKLDVDYSSQYGPRALFKYCFEVYEPPPLHIGPNFVFPPRNAVFDGVYGSDIHYIMDSYSSDPRCGDQHIYTGIRDSNIDPGDPIDPVIPFKVKMVYYMFNSILVKTVPLNVDIEVLGISITTDMDSWLWQLSMTIGKKEYLDLLRPSSPDGFKKIEININGWKWIFVVEGWSENTGNFKGTWNVTGRSPSLLLGDPICEPKTFVNEIASTGSALMQTILDASYGYSVYTVDWSSYGGAKTQTGFDPAAPGATWNIPANGFSYSSQTNIQAIQSLADSIGAYVQSNQYFDGTVPELISVAPRYPYQPWNWSLTNPDINFVQLDFSIVHEMSSTYKKNPDYYGVYLVGTAGKDGDVFSAAFGNVYREGYGPSSMHAPLVSNSLFTTDEVIREYGRKVLAESGMWADHSVKVFSLFPEGAVPGLLRVGTMINMTNPLNSSNNFQGIVKSLNVQATVVNKSAFAVSQNITIAQYLGEWDV